MAFWCTVYKGTLHNLLIHFGTFRSMVVHRCVHAHTLMYTHTHAQHTRAHSHSHTHTQADTETCAHTHWCPHSNVQYIYYTLQTLAWTIQVTLTHLFLSACVGSAQDNLNSFQGIQDKQGTQDSGSTKERYSCKADWPVRVTCSLPKAVGGCEVVLYELPAQSGL